MKYRAVFFDLDGVLTTNHSGAEQTAAYLAKRFHVDIGTIRAIGAPYGKDLGLGKITHEGLVEELRKHLNKDITMSDLEEAFRSTPKNQPMFDLVAELKQQGCKVGIITDNDPLRFRVLKKELGLESLFHSLTTSGEVGAFKDEKKIFETALAAIGVDATDAIFIDNKKKNLIEAEVLGMHTIHFDDALNNVAGLRKELMELLPYA